MGNIIRNTASFAFYIASEYITEKGIVVDATCGNGHDTLAFARSQAEKVYAFDIQNQAIENTKKLLLENNIPEKKVSLINDSHGNMGKYVTNADVVMFNLGYLPLSDKSVITSKEETLKAVKEALRLLSKDGLCCIVAYDGHKGGSEEKAALLEFSQSLDPSLYHAAYISMINQKNNPPEIILITKKGKTNEDKTR